MVPLHIPNKYIHNSLMISLSMLVFLYNAKECGLVFVSTTVPMHTMLESSLVLHISKDVQQTVIFPCSVPGQLLHIGILSYSLIAPTSEQPSPLFSAPPPHSYRFVTFPGFFPFTLPPTLPFSCTMVIASGLMPSSNRLPHTHPSYLTLLPGNSQRRTSITRCSMSEKPQVPTSP